MTKPPLTEYEKDLFCNPAGENRITFSKEGVSVQKEPPSETRLSWKGARRILSLPDDAIQAVRRRNSEITDYHIDGASVSHPHGKSGRYLCHRHQKNDCPEVRRVRRYLEERVT